MVKSKAQLTTKQQQQQQRYTEEKDRQRRIRSAKHFDVIGEFLYSICLCVSVYCLALIPSPRYYVCAKLHFNINFIIASIPSVIIFHNYELKGFIIHLFRIVMVLRYVRRRRRCCCRRAFIYVQIHAICIHAMCAKQDRENATAKEMEAIEIHRVVCSCVHAYCAQFESKPMEHIQTARSVSRKKELNRREKSSSSSRNGMTI